MIVEIMDLNDHDRVIILTIDMPVPPIVGDELTIMEDGEPYFWKVALRYFVIEDGKFEKIVLYVEDL